MNRYFVAGLASVVLSIIGCGSGSEDAEEEVHVPVIDCTTATVPTYAELTFLKTTCSECHSSTKAGPERQEAPTDVNWDTYAAAKTSAEKGVSELYEDPPAMPPATSDLPAVTEAERVAFNTWAQCGTPE